MASLIRMTVIVLALVGAVVTADAQPRRPQPRLGTRAPVAESALSPGGRPVIVRPVLVPWYAQPTYESVYQHELRKRWPPRPQATQSFHGSSPRCPWFFCEGGVNG
jgi:hypothetical protein